MVTFREQKPRRDFPAGVLFWLQRQRCHFKPSEKPVLLNDQFMRAFRTIGCNGFQEVNSCGVV